MKGATRLHNETLGALAGYLQMSQEGMEATQRWKKYVAKGSTPENDLQHTFTASLLAVYMLESILTHSPGMAINPYHILRCVILHDLGEITTQDTHYIDKTADSDLLEYQAFLDMLPVTAPDIRSRLGKAYLLQFAHGQSALASDNQCPAEVKKQLNEFKHKHRFDALLFEAIERYGYLIYACKEYSTKGNTALLVQVLRNQHKPLCTLAKEVPAFGDLFYPDPFQAEVNGFLQQHQGQYIEEPSN